MNVSTLSGKANNGIYTNGVGSNSTYIFPSGVTVDSIGNVYAFSDYINVIRKIYPDGFTSQFCGDATFANGSYSYGFVDGDATTARFANITCITIDKQDNLYVIDHNRLRKITPLGVVSTITNNQSDFKSPEGICVDALGNVYVSDTGNKKIKKVDVNGVVSTIALGFTEPKGITLNAVGDLLVADVTAIKRVTLSGTVTTVASGFLSVTGIIVDAQGNINVTDSHANNIKKVDSNGIVSVITGSSPGFTDSSTLFFWRVPRFYNPKGLTIDKNGILYTADTWNQRIRKIIK